MKALLSHPRGWGSSKSSSLGELQIGMQLEGCPVSLLLLFGSWQQRSKNNHLFGISAAKIQKQMVTFGSQLLIIKNHYLFWDINNQQPKITIYFGISTADNQKQPLNISLNVSVHYVFGSQHTELKMGCYKNTYIS